MSCTVNFQKKTTSCTMYAAALLPEFGICICGCVSVIVLNDADAGYRVCQKRIPQIVHSYQFVYALLQQHGPISKSDRLSERRTCPARIGTMTRCHSRCASTTRAPMMATRVQPLQMKWGPESLLLASPQQSSLSCRYAGATQLMPTTVLGLFCRNPILGYSNLQIPALSLR